MIVNTRRLFTMLLPNMGINAVCDVGSMDGSDALSFRAAAPQARVFAFEPNPENFARMQDTAALRDPEIELVSLAATNYDGTAELFVMKEANASGEDWRGMSSLYWRPEESARLMAVPVETTRLDTFLAVPGRCPRDLRLALWIDVEGKAYEVIEGMAGLAEGVQLLHVEVEGAPCIAPEQRLYPDVLALLRKAGLVLLATDLPAGISQFNAVFVRRDLPAATQLRIAGCLALTRLRRVVGSALSRLTNRRKKQA